MKSVVQNRFFAEHKIAFPKFMFLSEKYSFKFRKSLNAALITQS